MRLGVFVSAFALAVGTASAEPLSVPFDFSNAALGLDVAIDGKPLYMILDTGVDPSAIDIARAEALGIKVDRAAGGEASGEGDDKEAKIYPAPMTGLSIAGRGFAPFDALAMDMSALSKGYRRQLDGVLGYSFLAGRAILIDYPQSRLEILDAPVQAWPSVATCRKRWSAPLKNFGDDTIPIIDGFRFGAASGPISLDTGSNGGITLYQGALDLPGVKAALVETGERTATGARGTTKIKTYVLNQAVGFGPFGLPAGQAVALRPAKGAPEPRMANIGNKLFAAMGLKMLLDYRGRVMTFYGDCGPRRRQKNSR
ncbi:MAG: retropepsin-like domain-containing protein [Alphaproteobacteria bacterium]|nr:retropepsin-like domain-containing protein [Alphaproteobacteria bacterium]